MKPIRVHFSCGAASAVSLLIAADLGQTHGIKVDAVYADTGGEHPDNMRFLQDIEKQAGITVQIVRSEKYSSPFDVWEKRRYIAGPHGAPCTSELKRRPLSQFWEPEYQHVFGFTNSERARLANIQEREKPIEIRSLLIERGISKADCFQFLHGVGIELPEMYRLGFNNANCIGCPKGGKGYWNHIRRIFPEHFNKVATLQREIGVSAAFWEGHGGDRLMLDELPVNAGRHNEPEIQCGLFCTDAAEALNLIKAPAAKVRGGGE